MSFEEIIEQNRQNFIRFNGMKYARFQQLFANQTINRTINSIPLLLSLNDPKLPGYVQGNPPLGIHNYRPDDDVVKYLTAKYHLTAMNVRTADPFIEMLAVMGSVGTIAYTRDSDLDYWVCVDSRKAEPGALELLHRKIEGIQTWVKQEAKLEVHLFLNDVENIKRNIYAEDEDEAFGSTVGATLKDEFFRSSIIITGKIPFWWVIPRVDDSAYGKLYDRLSDEQRQKVYVDLGNLFEISREDFLGAALFQLIKALGNPFKSILKIGVLEKYLFESDSTMLLSHKIKAKISRGEIDLGILDSYVLMFEEVYTYYQKTLEDKNLLKILRQNLYLKINPQLSKYLGIQNSKNLPYKVSVMFSYVNKWGWMEKEIRELDDFDNWDYNRIMQLWNSVKKFMLLSYQKISSQLPQLNLAQRISNSDFMLLSRKIKANFMSDANEIDRYITFKETSYEPILYIEPLSEGVQALEWRLFKRNSSAKDTFVSTTLKTEKNLMRLLAWTAVNMLFDPATSRVKIQSGYSRINPNLIQNLLTDMHKLFSANRVYIKNEFLLKESFSVQNMIIVNFNRENADKIETIHLLYRTSWGQSYLMEYEGDREVVPILTSVLNDGMMLRRPFDEFCMVSTPEPHRKIYKELERLFRNTYDSIVLSEPEKNVRATCRWTDSYITASRDGNTISLSRQENLARLFAALTLRPSLNNKHSFFGDDRRMEIMAFIYEKRTYNSLVVLYEETGDFIMTHVLDENGNIFTYIKPRAIKEKHLAILLSFCKSVAAAINAAGANPPLNEKVMIYRITDNRTGTPLIDNETSTVEDILRIKYSGPQGLSVTVNRIAEGGALYRLMTPDRTMSEFAPLNLVPQKARDRGLALGGAHNLISAMEITGASSGKTGAMVYLLERYRLDITLDRFFK